MKPEPVKRIEDLLCFIYGESAGRELYPRFLELIAAFKPAAGSAARSSIGGGDALLITYGNILFPPEQADSGAGESGLARLSGFLTKWNRGAFTYLHILPFHPYSSDDGFSVIDYRQVDGRFGSWDDIEVLGRRFKMVFDFVINHGSVESSWFKDFLAGREEKAGWYLTRPRDYDYASVVRPRTSPLLTPFKRKDGSDVYVWTTFSADQADYDFSNPAVLLEFTGILLEYARRGGRIVRLDAIAYLWKEDGTPCLHHPRTHAVVKLFRAVIDALDLDMLILTETNVPHEQNISYFGGKTGAASLDSLPEAHMVYNFALPPLVLHAAVSGDAGPLRAWAGNLPPPEPGRLFLNFLASHDGVGLTPAKGLVDEAAFAATIAEAQNRGALVSYKASPGGAVPYELNCSYASVVAPASLGSPELRARAFLAAQAVLLALPGLPAVYFHSWIGSGAWTRGPALLGYNRAINREKPALDKVEGELENPASFRSLVYRGFKQLLAFRQEEESCRQAGALGAFDPRSACRVLESPGPVFALLRGSGDRRVLCAQNLGPRPVSFKITEPGSPVPELSLGPWETRWIARGVHAGGGGAVRSLSSAG
ncbi:MAG: sugar phosphorylase [Treponema sp.]|jgi:sucrose phosphorylase|nr:sugar phosphorylase [Treponema sp.]